MKLVSNTRFSLILLLLAILTITNGVMSATETSSSSASTSVSTTSSSSRSSVSSTSSSENKSNSSPKSSSNTNTSKSDSSSQTSTKSSTSSSSSSQSSPKSTSNSSSDSQSSTTNSATTTKSMPSLKTTTTTADTSNTTSTTFNGGNYTVTSSSSSYLATFTPIVPDESTNQYIYRAKHTGGTVFIAVGSCLGFILLIVGIAWGMLAFSAWHSARKEYKLKEIESKYQYDPFYFSQNADDSTSYSEGDDNSDISEKVLRTRNSRMTLHTLGSASVLNLLQGDNKSADLLESTNKLENNKRQSMFISPTEILRVEGANQSHVWQDGNMSSGSLFESVGSTPREQQHTQFINNPSVSNLTSNAAWRNSINPKDYLHYNPSLLTPDLTNSPAGTIDTDKSKDHAAQARKKNYRPPSMHLDHLLNGDDS